LASQNLKMADFFREIGWLQHLNLASQNLKMAVFFRGKLAG
jgi:hypothetical protein